MRLHFPSSPLAAPTTFLAAAHLILLASQSGALPLPSTERALGAATPGSLSLSSSSRGLDGDAGLLVALPPLFSALSPPRPQLEDPSRASLAFRSTLAESLLRLLIHLLLSSTYSSLFDRPLFGLLASLCSVHLLTPLTPRSSARADPSSSANAGHQGVPLSTPTPSPATVLAAAGDAAAIITTVPTIASSNTAIPFPSVTSPFLAEGAVGAMGESSHRTMRPLAIGLISAALVVLMSIALILVYRAQTRRRARIRFDDDQKDARRRDVEAVEQQAAENEDRRRRANRHSGAAAGRHGSVASSGSGSSVETKVGDEVIVEKGGKGNEEL